MTAETYRSVFRPGLFVGRNIIVTGGGSGIGRCTAHELASLGAHVILIGRTPAKLQAVAAEIAAVEGQSADQVSCYPLDIREAEAVKSTVKQIMSDREQIHGLVNNAGGQFPAPLSQISVNGWETVIRNNLTGGFLMAQAVFNQSFAKNKGGAIVNIIADMWRGMPMMGHSGAARAGMMNFTETAAVEWGLLGTRVNAVAPGFIASSGLDSYDPNFARSALGMMLSEIPLGRLGVEAEISAAICFLLSDAASFVSGTCIPVDGAATCNSKGVPLKAHQYCPAYDGFPLAEEPKILQTMSNNKG